MSKPCVCSKCNSSEVHVLNDIDNETFWVECLGCGSTSEDFMGPSWAINAWNDDHEHSSQV